MKFGESGRWERNSYHTDSIIYLLQLCTKHTDYFISSYKPVRASDMTGKTDFPCQKVNENEYSNTMASSKDEEKALGQN